MGMSIAIKDFEMPNTCGDCPYCIYTADEKRYIGYCNTSDDDYFCKALDRFMEYDKVDGGVDILGKPLDCPLVEAIPKDQYEARLKADLEAILVDLQLDVEEQKFDVHTDKDVWNDAIRVCSDIIQQKINELPLVTPQEPRKGHWINKQHLLSSCSAECSSCQKRSNGYVFDNGFSLESKFYDFCPNCGAKMESEE